MELMELPTLSFFTCKFPLSLCFLL